MEGLPNVSPEVALDVLFFTAMLNSPGFSSNIDDIIEYWRKESYLSHLDHGEDVGTPGNAME